VVVNLALGGIIARVFDGARVLAPFVDASTIRRAVRVGPALNGRARDVRVALQPDGTGADGFVTDSGTFGVSSAGQVVGAANRCTFSCSASVSFFALAIRLAANLKRNKFACLFRFKM